jgi:hypothetical protein
MTVFKVGSTLGVVAWLGAAAPPAQAQTADSAVTRSMWGVYAGYGEGSQFVAGVQLQLRTPLRPLTVVPEAAIAHGASLLTGAGLHLAPVGSTLRPYAGLSLGYLWDGTDDDATNAFVFTPKAGLLLDARKVHWMLEYQGVNWFEQYRLLVGVRWPM